MASKKILVTAFHNLITKNILNTDVFSILKSQKDWQIILAVPDNKVDFFKQIYEDQQTTVVGVSMVELGRDKRVKFFSRFFYSILDSHYLNYKKVERLDKNRTIPGYLKYALDFTLTKCLKRISLLYSFWRWLFLRLVRPVVISQLFDTHSPDVVFLTDVFAEADVVIAGEARRREINLIGMVRSWDNCNSKGILRVLPDEMIVNNQILKDEAVSIHKMDSQHIFVGGLPQFDQYLVGTRTSREQFFKTLRLDPLKKLIVFAPAGAILSDIDWQIGEILNQAILQAEIKQPVQILIRNHPNHPADFSKLVNIENFAIEVPGKTFDGNLKDTELTKQDSVHLADTLYHADVVIYIATTLGLDSLVFNKPQIIVDFDGYEKRGYYQSVRRYHDEDHMRKMIACGGARVAFSASDLIKAINDYLENPTLDQIGRDKMVVQQLYKSDGQSGKRIGEFLIKKMTS